MRAVTGYRRISILAIAATLLAGCGANPAATTVPSTIALLPSPSSPGGSDAPSPAPTAATTPAPASTPHAPVPSPTGPTGSSLCPPTLPPQEPVVGLWDLSGLVSTHLDIRSVAALTDPQTALPVPPPVAFPGPVNLVGGRDVTFDLSWYEASWYHFTTFTRFRATLDIDGLDPLELPIRFESRNRGKANVAIATVPDLDAAGRIDIRLEFRDQCFVVAGRVSSPVRIYSAASVAACPRDRDAGFEELGETFDPPIRIAGVAVDLLPWHFIGKVAELWVVDPLPPYVGFDRDAPTLGAAPGSAIDVTNPNDSIELDPADEDPVIFFRRGQLLRWVENGWIHGDEPDAEIVFRSKLIELPDGTFSFVVPSEPGRYVAQVAFGYDAACSLGRAGAAVGIDVVAP